VKVSIRNFKSVREAKMRLGRVTVHLGPAASGKTNILEALALARQPEAQIFPQFFNLL